MIDDMGRGRESEQEKWLAVGREGVVIYEVWQQFPFGGFASFLEFRVLFQ